MRNTRRSFVLGALVLASCFAMSIASTSAHAQDGPGPAALRVRSLAATCAQCHGTDGRAVDGAAVAGLAGKSAAGFIEQMKAFKSGERTGTVMPQLAKGFDDEQIAQLAAYFAGPAAAIKR
jgi:sulfide dehydrogenase cytochrome subunit